MKTQVYVALSTQEKKDLDRFRRLDQRRSLSDAARVLLIRGLASVVSEPKGKESK